MALFSKILVALDGSLTAESALPFLANVVRSDKPDEVVLMTVVERLGDEDMQAARAYLHYTTNDLEAWWKREGFALPLIHMNAVRLKESALVDARGRPRPPARKDIAAAILEVAKASNVDLIVITANGWLGSDKWLLGMVAENILQNAQTNVFVVRADDYRSLAPLVRMRRILVPLDGSDLAEQALPIARTIARTMGSDVLRLVYVRMPHEGAASRVVRPTMDFRPFPKGEPRGYLTTVAEGLARDGVTVEIDIREGDPGREINEDATEQEIDLIVMASHGRTGLHVKPYGKVADEVVHAAPVPVLFIRPKEAFVPA